MVRKLHRKCALSRKTGAGQLEVYKPAAAGQGAALRKRVEAGRGFQGKRKIGRREKGEKVYKPG